MSFGRPVPWSDWNAFWRRHRLPEGDVATLLPPGGRLVVVAPHPDDEVIMAGGLLHRLAGLERALMVVAVTDGEASHAGSPAWPPAHLAAQRRAESALALHHLAPKARILRLGLPDGGVAQAAASLRSRLAGLLRAGDVLVTTWRHDGHPDHEATARACAAVVHERPAILYETPVWAWRWMHPSDRRWPWHRATVFALGVGDVMAKRTALRSFVSQWMPDAASGGSPVLPACMLRAWLRRGEVLFRDEPQ